MNQRLGIHHRISGAAYPDCNSIINTLAHTETTGLTVTQTTAFGAGIWRAAGHQTTIVAGLRATGRAAQSVYGISNRIARTINT